MSNMYLFIFTLLPLKNSLKLVWPLQVCNPLSFNYYRKFRVTFVKFWRIWVFSSIQLKVWEIWGWVGWKGRKGETRGCKVVLRNDGIHHLSSYRRFVSWIRFAPPSSQPLAMPPLMVQRVDTTKESCEAGFPRRLWAEESVGTIFVRREREKER